MYPVVEFHPSVDSNIIILYVYPSILLPLESLVGSVTISIFSAFTESFKVFEYTFGSVKICVEFPLNLHLYPIFNKYPISLVNTVSSGLIKFHISLYDSPS